jgi:hypothetical protein
LIVAKKSQVQFGVTHVQRKYRAKSKITKLESAGQGAQYRRHSGSAWAKAISLTEAIAAS